MKNTNWKPGRAVLVGLSLWLAASPLARVASAACSTTTCQAKKQINAALKNGGTFSIIQSTPGKAKAAWNYANTQAANHGLTVTGSNAGKHNSKKYGVNYGGYVTAQ